MEAISHAGSSLGIVSKNGIVLAAEKKIISKLLDNDKKTEKMFKIDNHIACVVAGITADANILIENARLSAQQHYYTYQEPVPVEQLVQQLCDVKQGYTQFGGMRPFGVSLLYAGWDENYGFQLYHSDPSGNYGGWKATAIGANSHNAESILKRDWKEDLSLEDAILLAIKVMSKTMDSTNLTPEKLEFSILKKEGKTVSYHVLTETEVQDYIKKAEKMVKEENKDEI